METMLPVSCVTNTHLISLVAKYTVYCRIISEYVTYLYIVAVQNSHIIINIVLRNETHCFPLFTIYTKNVKHII